MTKILEIESCFCCSNAENCSEYNTDNCNTIPKTCPLSDKPEPITEGWVKDLCDKVWLEFKESGKESDDRLFYQKIKEQVNAHFLGGAGLG